MTRAQPARQLLSLAELATGQTAVIISLGSGRGVRHRLRSLGIMEGQLIRKISRIGRFGPVVLLVNRAQIAVGYGMARNIFVKVQP